MRPSSGYYREGAKRTPGNRLPSVTTILKLWGEPGGLLYWANTKGLEGKTLQDARNESGVHAGHQAHRWVEQDLKGLQMQPADDSLGRKDIEAARAGFRAYEDWKTALRGFRALETELPLCHPTLDYAGTLDCLAAILRPIGVDEEGVFRGLPLENEDEPGSPGHLPRADRQVLVLADWKLTGGTYPEHIYQGAAYIGLYEATHPGETIEEFHALRFGKPTDDGLSRGGDFHHHKFTREQMDVAFDAFQHILAAYKIDKAVKKWVR